MYILGGGNSNMFYFCLGKQSNVANILQTGWNQQLVYEYALRQSNTAMERFPFVHVVPIGQGQFPSLC